MVLPQLSESIRRREYVEARQAAKKYAQRAKDLEQHPKVDYDDEIAPVMGVTHVVGADRNADDSPDPQNNGWSFITSH